MVVVATQATDCQDGQDQREREVFIDNLLVRIHLIIVMIRWTGLAPWEFEFPFPGSRTSTFLCQVALHLPSGRINQGMVVVATSSSSLLLSSLELSDTKVYEP